MTTAFTFAYVNKKKGFKFLCQHQGLRSRIPRYLVGTIRASRECGQILEKPRYTVYKVPLTRESLRAHFCSPTMFLYEVKKTDIN